VFGGPSWVLNLLDRPCQPALPQNPAGGTAPKPAGGGNFHGPPTPTFGAAGACEKPVRPFRGRELAGPMGPAPRGVWPKFAPGIAWHTLLRPIFFVVPKSALGWGTHGDFWLGGGGGWTGFGGNSGSPAISRGGPTATWIRARDPPKPAFEIARGKNGGAGRPFPQHSPQPFKRGPPGWNISPRGKQASMGRGVMPGGAFWGCVRRLLRDGASCESDDRLKKSRLVGHGAPSGGGHCGCSSGGDGSYGDF